MKRKIITDLEKLKNPAAIVKLKIEDEEIKAEINKVIKNIKDTLNAHDGLLALSAPQINTDMRIIGIKFNDDIKIFINPVITKKLNFAIGAETCASLPGKEIVLARPEEVSIIYYNEKFSYEDNKLLGVAARLFDQQVHILDGVTPDELGLVSDIEEDGPVSALTEEEFEQVKQIYSQLVAIKAKTSGEAIMQDEELSAKYKELKFAEQVISGKAAIVEDESERIKAKQKRSITGGLIRKQQMVEDKKYRKASLDAFLKKIGK